MYILYSSIIIVFVECIQVTVAYALSVPSTITCLVLYIVVLIHFIVSSVAATAPNSYYEYDSHKQTDSSDA